MNPILVDLGFVQIHWYSVLILLGMLIGTTIILKEGKKFNIPKDFMNNMFFYAIIFGLIGARLYYVAFNWSDYQDNLLDIFAIWNGGLAIHGGLIFGFIFVALYSWKYKANLFRILDVTVLGLFIGQAIGRWGNFFNGEAHGPLTSVEFLENIFVPQFIIDGMNINGFYYHPTFLYESLWCIVGFIILLLIKRFYYWKIGQSTAFYLIWYGIGRYLIESLRTDSLMLFDFKIAQLVSIFMVVGGVILFIIKASGSKFRNRYNDKENVENILF